MQQYELTPIFKPDVTEEKIDGSIKNLKLKVLHRQIWGKRLLAYPINDYKEGMYAFFVVELAPEAIVTTERAMQLNDEVLRHLLVRAEKEL